MNNITKIISVLIVTEPIFNIIVPSSLPIMSFDVRELNAKLENKRKAKML
tara:strand:- start:272 stop:421 length:150 start_codon:yes stop_codon:yes gene_type:complete